MSNDRSLIYRTPVIFMKRFLLLLYCIEKMVVDKTDYNASTENKHAKCV